MEIKGIFYFDPSDKIYGDHFPGNPVVPGSIIVNAFLEAGRNADFEADECVVEGFRFREFVSPDEHAFSIQILSNGMKCTLYQNRSHASKIVATGTIKI